MDEAPQSDLSNIQTHPAVNNKKKFSVAKFLLFLFGSLIVAVIICETLGWPFLRAPVENFASKQLERTVKIDQPFNLKLLGGVKLNVGGLYISAPKKFEVSHFIETENISLNLRYSDLFKFKKSNQLRIKSLRVNQIDAQLLRRQDGTSTWQFNDNPSKPESPFPIIETLFVQNGSAKIVDPQTQIDLMAKFHTDEGNLNQTTNKQTARSVVEIQGKFTKKAIKGQLYTEGFLPIATHDSSSPPISSKAWVEHAGLRADFIGTVSDLFGKHDVKGKLTVKGPSLSVLGQLVNVVLPTTDKFSLSTLIEKNSEVWTANAVSARVGKSDLNGNFTYDPRPVRPLLKGNLGGKRFFLADLAPSFGTKNIDGSIATPGNGQVIPDRPLDLPSLNKMDARITVDLQYVELGNAFSRPIAPLKADLWLNSGKLSLSKIDARTADGSIAGLISIDTRLKDKPLANEAKLTNSTKKTALAPIWNINLRWKDIDVEKWLKVSTDPQKQARLKNKKESPPSYVTGTLNGKTKLTGTGNSTAEMLSSLDGDVTIYIHKGTISHLIVEALGLDIAQGLGILLTKDNALPMQCAVMDLTAKKGVATPKVALLDTPVTLVLIDGNVNLAKETLDLRLAAKPKNMSPFTVRSPIHVKGTFKNPDVSIEKTPIVARVLGGIALAFINPLAAIVPFLDAGSGEESPCTQSLADFKTKP